MAETTAHAQTLASYRVDDTHRQLVAVHVPGESTVRILDVLATPLPEDRDVDPIEIEPACPADEAPAIADDYAPSLPVRAGSRCAGAGTESGAPAGRRPPRSRSV